MIHWEIDEEDFIELLENRVDEWVKDRTYDEQQTWYGFFESLVDNGCFTEVSESINSIVDNAIVNYYQYYATIEEIENDFSPKTTEELEDRIYYSGEYGYIVNCC